MKTSSTMLQLLDHLRKEEKDWRSARWYYLFMSLIPLVGNLWVAWRYQALIQLFDDIFKEKSLEAGFYLSLGASGSLILGFFGALGFGHVIKNWRGDRTRQFLILMAEQDFEPTAGSAETFSPRR